MTPKWQKLASLAQEICKPWFQFFGAVFASKGYHFKNITETLDHLDMESLESRKTKVQRTMMFRIFNNLMDSIAEPISSIK